MDLGPVILALTAGGLATVNPCGFAMLPAFLSFYVGADEDQLPRAFSRTFQGVITGMLVAAGVLVVFGVVALPITYGATQVVRAIPWAGIALGLLLIAFGVATTLGKAFYLRLANPIRPEREKQPKAMFVFGMGYGVASLGCTLPVFLAVFGASLATQSTASSLLVLGAYGLGMAVTLVLLSIGAALLRNGLAKTLKNLTPHMPQITGSVLVVAGLYLTYYWGRVQFGSAATLGDDPIVGFVGDFTAVVERFAAGNGQLLVLGAGLTVVAVVVGSLWKRHTNSGNYASAEDGAGGLVESSKASVQPGRSGLPDSDEGEPDD